VNDLASVNVDAGTVRRASANEEGVETLELQRPYPHPYPYQYPYP